MARVAPSGPWWSASGARRAPAAGNGSMNSRISEFPPAARRRARIRPAFSIVPENSRRPGKRPRDRPFAEPAPNIYGINSLIQEFPARAARATDSQGQSRWSPSRLAFADVLSGPRGAARAARPWWSAWRARRAARSRRRWSARRARRVASDLALSDDRCIFSHNLLSGGVESLDFHSSALRPHRRPQAILRPETTKHDHRPCVECAGAPL
jgi:hypothetical protein